MDIRKEELLKIMEDSTRLAMERAAAGNELARLGDPRLEVMTTEHMQFCRIPEGEFLMGEKLEKVNLPEFFISRYPITNAQFTDFVNARGYQQKSYWAEAEEVGYWKVGVVKGRWDGDNERRTAPADYGEPSNLLNHPVVGVSWYEALAFSHWLDEKLRKTGGFHVFSEEQIWEFDEGYRVGLPDEAQWEKAARGTDGREYPWEGDYFSTNNANTWETSIGATSAVGCFPGGASPYGVLEMSGNVSEWTTWDDRKRIVIRGGSFDRSYRGFALCAYRADWSYPDFGNRYGGFRVVVSPVLLS